MMKEYGMTLTAVALLGGVLGMLSPEGDLKKYIRLVVALCLLCAMVQPLIAAWSEGGWLSGETWQLWKWEETEDYDDIYKQSLLSGSEKQVSSLLKQQILSEFQVSEASVDVVVKIEMENDRSEVREIWITLREEAVFIDPKRITALIEEQWECPCTILYDS